MDAPAEEPASVERCPVEHVQTFVGDLVGSSSSRPIFWSVTIWPAPNRC
jgi:hypothetical protein